MKKNRVEIEDSFWSSRIRQMCDTIIPYQYAVLNDQIPGIPRSHAIENFRIAARAFRRNVPGDAVPGQRCGEMDRSGGLVSWNQRKSGD